MSRDSIDDEKRVKILRVPKQDIVHMLHGDEYKQSVRFKVLPEGFRVRDVGFDICTRCFHFLIWHESFDIVENGVVPEFIDTMHYVLKEYEKLDEKSSFLQI